MFDAIAPRYELVNKVMTLGLDTRWRRRALADLRLARNSVVLDVATGTGDFARELDDSITRAVGTDLSYNMLYEASPRARACPGRRLDAAVSWGQF